MTSIGAGFPVYETNAGGAFKLQKQLANIAYSSEEKYQQYVKSAERLLESQHMRPDSAGSSARNQPFATVEVNGRTVAKIDNNGFVQSSNAIGARFHKLFANEDPNLSGPALAELRANKIAEHLGGKVVKSATALTPAQYNAASKTNANVDKPAMQQDTFYSHLQKAKEARTLFLAQQYSQETSSTSAETGENEAEDSSIYLATSLGMKSFDLDTYFGPPKPGTPRPDINDVPLLLPTARNVDALSSHAEKKLKELMASYGIAKAPKQISYDGAGELQLPDAYGYKEEFTRALEENPGMADELRTIAALASQHVGIQAASEGGVPTGGYAQITIDFSPSGDLSVKADGKPYAAKEDSAEQWFRDFMKKSPAERYYEALLREKGLTPEDLERMPPEERAKVEEAIRAEIRRRLEEDKGFDTESTEATET